MNDFKNSCLNECLFVILGGTGDLAKRKLIPAIYKLSEENKLCKFSVVLVSNLQTNVSQIFEQAKPFITRVNDAVWQKIQDRTRYFKMDFNDSSEYAELKTLLEHVENKDNLVGNRVFYFATMPEHFEVISRNFAFHKIVPDKSNADACCKSPWARLVYEKPFGFDLASAKNINQYITQIFDELQIYRIDHYLGKELVGNIALVRFTNQVFEPLWNNKNIDSVAINIFEDIGVGSRGAFYDSYGAVKDMVQSHMLQIMALVAMEPPQKLSSDFIRDAKANVLNQVEIEKVVLGQYE